MNISEKNHVGIFGLYTLSSELGTAVWYYWENLSKGLFADVYSLTVNHRNKNDRTNEQNNSLSDLNALKVP